MYVLCHTGQWNFLWLLEHQASAVTWAIRLSLGGQTPSGLILERLVELKLQVEFPVVILISALASADEIPSFAALQCRLIESASWVLAQLLYSSFCHHLVIFKKPVKLSSQDVPSVGTHATPLSSQLALPSLRSAQSTYWSCLHLTIFASKVRHWRKVLCCHCASLHCHHLCLRLQQMWHGKHKFTGFSRVAQIHC